MKMENHKEFHRDDLLDRAVDAVLREPTPDDVSPDRVKQLAAVVRQAAERPSSISIITRIKNMRASTRIVVAATVVVAILGLMSWLVPGSGPALAFADVADALVKVHSVTWKSTLTAKEPKTKDVVHNRIDMYLAPSFSRTETVSPEGEKSICIVDGRKNRMIRLDVARKNASVSNWGQNPNEPPPTNPSLHHFQRLQELFADAKNGKGGTVGAVVPLGVKAIDGRAAEGFRMTRKDIDGDVVETNIWADMKTLLPVRMEQIITRPSEPGEFRIEMSDFRVGVDLDKSLFSVDVPAGYTVEHVNLPGTLQPVSPKETQDTPEKEPPKEPESKDSPKP
jgi:outer membrane lipoprotein-sorting protein